MSWQISAKAGVDCDMFLIGAVLSAFQSFGHNFGYGIIAILFGVMGSVVILLLYLLVTVVFAIPSFLVLYFAFLVLERLVREITS
ncbi:hypothetical protein F3Y22_tig00110429pilonHSYRG00911 [Hibiscus syriacus]|uniref:Uncharacterized protein n=1 Tax=Hibiscus syriacus TaxID=106335 RepID=A0A6A3AQ77_HIBSY|nr:hypothetical protein F3Y22_tig00110429pilonHSYRG00911 [Hibiscus syriacus]